MTALLLIAVVLAYLILGVTTIRMAARHEPSLLDDRWLAGVLVLVWPAVAIAGLILILGLLTGPKR
jgi:hypothetical protein